MVAVLASFELFTFFLIGLNDLNDSAIFIFLSIFQKIRMSKNVVSKNKCCFSYKLMLLEIKKKIMKKLLRSILQEVLFK